MLFFFFVWECPFLGPNNFQYAVGGVHFRFLLELSSDKGLYPEPSARLSPILSQREQESSPAAGGEFCGTGWTSLRTSALASRWAVMRASCSTASDEKMAKRAYQVQNTSTDVQCIYIYIYIYIFVCVCMYMSNCIYS